MKSSEMLKKVMLDYVAALNSGRQADIEEKRIWVVEAEKVFRRDRAYLEQQNPACRRTGDRILAKEYGKIQDPWNGGKD